MKIKRNRTIYGAYPGAIPMTCLACRHAKQLTMGHVLAWMCSRFSSEVGAVPVFLVGIQPAGSAVAQVAEKCEYFEAEDTETLEVE